MREIVPQTNERGRQAVDGDELMAGAGLRGPLPYPARRSMTAAFDLAVPWHGQVEGGRHAAPSGV
ncbi:hypothetical protein ACWD7F_28870, partial [Streptomyces sp. NPDC005122]